MKKIGIYKIKNIINNKVYIGSSINILDRKRTHLYKLRKNKHENNHLQNSFNKYGEKNFIFSIIIECDKEKRGEEEEKFIELYNSINRKFGYNICSKFNNKIVSEETKKKLSFRARNRTKEHQKKLSESKKGWKPSKETRRKMSLSHKGKFPSEETRKKMSISGKGKIVSEETRKKLRIINTGKKASEETKRKMAKTEEQKEHLRIINTGKKMSKETKRRMSLSHKGKNKGKDNGMYKKALAKRLELEKLKKDKE